jgi:hypothetical protein
MDTELGHAPLLARGFSEEALIMVGVAGLLRLMVYPLYPRGLDSPESAATSLLPAGIGVYLLTRVQSLSPILADRPWVLALGGLALLAGGLLASLASGGPQAQRGTPESGFVRVWSGAAVFQVGLAVAFAALLSTATPWPMLTLTLALGALAVWWEGAFDEATGNQSGTPGWMEQALADLAARGPALERWGRSWLAHHWRGLLPVLALAALVGLPITVGAVGRWSFYASILGSGERAMLVVALIADALLIVGLWSAFGIVLGLATARRHTLAATLSMAALVVPLVVLGVAPGTLATGFGIESLSARDVSVWGLGFAFLLPWIIGIWLIYVKNRSEAGLDPLWRLVGLGWVYQAADWVGQRLVAAVHWLGLVGEGDGWWGWALIILALGAMFLTLS